MYVLLAKMQLTWPFAVLISDDLHFLLDEYLEAVMDLSKTRTIARIKAACFPNLDNIHGGSLGDAAVVVVSVIILILTLLALALAVRAVISALSKWPLVLPSRHGLHTPPGTMGWPFFGETAELKAKRMSFYLEKRNKYGETFKSHLFGNACVVTTSWQAAKFVLVDHPELFRQRGLPSVERMLGTHFFGYTLKYGFHLRLRKQLHGLLAHLPTIIPHLEVQALSLMRTWLGVRQVHVLEETKLFAMRASILYVLGILPSEVNIELTQAFGSIIHGLDAWRIYLPWTKYYKACKGQRKASRIINQIIKERRSSVELCAQAATNVLEVLLEKSGTIQGLSDHELQESILNLLFTAHDASATILTSAMKFLNDDPTLIDTFRREHDMIAKQKATADLPLTWDDIKDMRVTQKVIKETLRMASPIDFSCREAIRDTAYDGFLIPKGWMMLVVHKTFHLDSHFWRHPHQFDAARFEVTPRPFTYTPFGNGAHVCVGRELAQLEIFVFLHHLTTKFTWEECRCSPATARAARINVPLSSTAAARDYYIRLRPREVGAGEFTTDDTYAAVVRDWNDCKVHWDWAAGLLYLFQTSSVPALELGSEVTD